MENLGNDVVNLRELERLAMVLTLEQGEKLLSEEHMDLKQLRDSYIKDAWKYNGGFFSTPDYVFRGGRELDLSIRNKLIDKAYGCCASESDTEYVMVQEVAMKMFRILNGKAIVDLLDRDFDISSKRF